MHLAILCEVRAVIITPPIEAAVTNILIGSDVKGKSRDTIRAKNDRQK